MKYFLSKSLTDHHDDDRGVQGVHGVPEEGDQAGHGADAARAQAEGHHGAHPEVPQSKCIFSGLPEDPM